VFLSAFSHSSAKYPVHDLDDEPSASFDFRAALDHARGQISYHFMGIRMFSLVD
jgi:hypothetical protein